MAIKKRTANIDEITIEDLANELADKPYGDVKEDNTITRTTISLPATVLFQLEDLAKKNKRKKYELRSVSALIRYCIKNSLKL